MRIETEVKLDFKDVLIRPKRSTLYSRSEVSLKRSFVNKHDTAHDWTDVVPILSANMDTTGTFEMANVMAKQRLIPVVHKHYSVEDWTNWVKGDGIEHQKLACVSTGITSEDFTKLANILLKTEVRRICLDVANGYSEKFVDAVRKTREAYSDYTIIAGNVVTGEMTEELILSGADIVKVGIGPGSVCTTRKETGVGYPQLHAVIECADAAHGLGGLVVSDGGCTCTGDVAKAFGAGADFVMLGGMFAGHDESAGDIQAIDGRKVKIFYGMSSATAMHKYAGGVAEYRASEGKTVTVPYRGPVENTIKDILGGLRSACTYVGATSLKELSKRTTFVRVSQQLNNAFDKEAVEPEPSR